MGNTGIRRHSDGGFMPSSSTRFKQSLNPCRRWTNDQNNLYRFNMSNCCTCSSHVFCFQGSTLSGGAVTTHAPPTKAETSSTAPPTAIIPVLTLMNPSFSTLNIEEPAAPFRGEPCPLHYSGAGDRDRTGTGLLSPRDFKSLASAYSATPAKDGF